MTEAAVRCSPSQETASKTSYVIGETEDAFAPLAYRRRRLGMGRTQVSA